MEITSDKPGKTESGKDVPAGTKVEYRGHVGARAINVLLDGAEEIMHPRCFPELR